MSILRRAMGYGLRAMGLTRGASCVAHHASRLFVLLFVAPLVHADALIDPTRPAFAPTKSAAVTHATEAASHVTAIFQTGGRRVAVIDGRVVKDGDRFGDVAIQEILADGVRITRAGRVEVVRLPKQAAPVRSDARKESIRQESRP